MLIEGLCTQALQTIFGEKYVFHVETKVSRNKPEMYFTHTIDGKERSFRDDTGGSVVDVASFALRLIAWAIQKHRTEPVMLLDEPFKNVDKVRLEYVGDVINELGELLGLQFGLVTHEEQLIQAADVGYRLVESDECGVECLKLKSQ
jgi:DNA repair exonuclease SbcCD ATPase subunit